MNTNKIRLKIYLIVFILLLSSGMTGFMLIEKFSFIDALYFTIVTMATVGYGDIHPLTDIGKFLALVIIIGGVGTFLGVVASVTDFFVNRREEIFRHQKLNMITGLFFSELGNDLLKSLTILDPEKARLNNMLKVEAGWEKEDFQKADRFARKRHQNLALSECDLPSLKDFLKTKNFLGLRAKIKRPDPSLKPLVPRF